VLDASATFLEVEPDARPSRRTQPIQAGLAGTSALGSTPAYPSFSTDSDMSPKEFILTKQPRSDVERIAALAYYLAHYRDIQQFKTLDLSKLNTEAAQPKFSNAASSANNAVKQGYLIPTTRGQRQLSAAGERFVSALPDREAARAAMSAAKPRRRQKRSRPEAKV
jgi:hypothetical protein